MARTGRYPNDWDSRRKAVYRRDSYTCQECGVKGGPHGNAELHAHHVTPISQGGGHQMGNLKTLCDECHRDAHGYGGSYEWFDWGSDPDYSPWVTYLILWPLAILISIFLLPFYLVYLLLKWLVT